ncbi:MAG: minC [Burkholderiales bacterium]|jgi:septum site-determining protein MinC|nr:minC [Burkholderiales bacterium]MCE3269084.1 minC [Burkholderiales bacterium]
MIRNNLKLNHGTFDYYVLQITPGIKLEDIDNKFLHFKAMCEENKNIVLDFSGEFDFANLSNLLLDINDTARVHGLIIHSIMENKCIKVHGILGIPVINLPNTTKIPHIYNRTLIVDEPVRSGIKIENDGDIVVTTFVSDNAEIIASGNIHIYGEARGRIIAGISGNKQSRIFMQSFNPELISISGIYKTLENELPQNIMHKTVMISLDDKDRLLLTPLTK